MKNNFEIHANGVNSTEILHRIEDKLRSRQYNAEEIEFVKNLSFTPSSPVGMKGFDPIETTDLLERTVPEPDFKNPKYRYIRGPIRWLAGRFFNVFALINDKLEENRIQAVYNIIHELIALNHKQVRLQKKLEALHAENLHLRRSIQAMVGGSISSGEETFQDSDLIPEPAPSQLAVMKELTNSRGDVLKGNLLILDDFWAHVSLFLKEEYSFSPILCSSEPFTIAYAKRHKIARLKTGTVEEVLFSCAENSIDTVLHSDLANASGSMESFVDLVSSRLKSGGYLIFGLGADDAGNPFQRNHRFHIKLELLFKNLEEMGFKRTPGATGAASNGAQSQGVYTFRKL